MRIEHQRHANPERGDTNMIQNNKVTVLKYLTREGTAISLMLQGGPAPVTNAWAALIISWLSYQVRKKRPTRAIWR